MNIWLILAIIELIIIGGLVAFGAFYLNGLNNVIKNADSISNGKLDVDDIDTYGRTANSSTVIAGSLNSIKNNLNTFIRASKTNVVTLSNTVSELSDSVENNKEGNTQIAEEASHVASKTKEQFEIVKDNLNIIEANNSHMAEIDSSIHFIEDLLKDSNRNTKEGLDTIAGYQQDMDAMTSELAKINGILTDFNDEINRISEIGDFIIGINDQLVLLALNASIEAARAGQAGKGFAVVAGQMNEMSVKTKEGMDSINAIVKEIITSSKQVNESINQCEEVYENSKETFNKVNRSFETINRQSIDINKKMIDISSKFKTLNDNARISREKAKSLYETSEAISASTNDIASFSQVASEEAAKIGESTQTLDSMLMSLQKLLVQFNTAVTPVKRDRSKRVKIMFISMLDNPFWYGVRNGVYYAITELLERNVDVDYVAINPEYMDIDETVRKSIRKAIDEGFDGIAFAGFLGGGNDLLKEAISKGIKVLAFNCECNSSVRRHGVVMPDIEELGVAAANAVSRKLDKGGNIVILNGNVEVDTNRIKHQAFMETIKKKKNITILDDILCSDDAGDVYKKTMEAIKKYPNCDVIYMVLGYPLAGAKAIEDSHANGSVSLVGYDHSQEIFQYIKKGVIACAVGQDDFAQGHDPIIWLYNNIVDGTPFPEPDGYIKIKSTLADSNNIGTLLDA